ncbi:MAG TPA: OmpA family protein, partial [Gammaproteobacteria bacterium]|nr:OmpA family protein [Gammaproteobacteria bacterium]
ALERVEKDTIKLNLSSEVSFDTNSAAIKPSFYSSLNKISGVVNQYDQTAIRIVGHTDSRGSDEYNQILSEKRAEAVSNYLNAQGVSLSRITTVGMGESQPIADNSTASGRSQNRRVEIFLKSTQSE